MSHYFTLTKRFVARVNSEVLTPVSIYALYRTENSSGVHRPITRHIRGRRLVNLYNTNFRGYTLF